MDRAQIHRMSKRQLVDFCMEWSNWIGGEPLARWSKAELVDFALETIGRPPLTEAQRADIKVSRS